MHLLTILISTALHFLSISTLAIINRPAALITLPAHNLTLPHFLTDSEPKCVRIDEPSMIGLRPSSCDLAYPIICERLSRRRPQDLVRDTWIWTELPGCAVGYYLPEEEAVPPEETCKGIFESLLEKCAVNSRFNAGGVNVVEMPDFLGPGEAEDAERMRYAFAPERLTLPS